MTHLSERVGMHDGVGIDRHNDFTDRCRDSGIAGRSKVPLFVYHDHGTSGLGDGLRRVGAAVGDDDDLGTRTGTRDCASDRLQSSRKQRLLVMSGHDDREPSARGHGEVSAAHAVV